MRFVWRLLRKFSFFLFFFFVISARLNAKGKVANGWIGWNDLVGGRVCLLWPVGVYFFCVLFLLHFFIAFVLFQTFPGRCTFTGLRLIGSTGNWGNTIPGFDVFLFTQAQFDKYKMGNIVSGGTSVTYAPFTITQTRVTAADNTENERTYQGSMTDLIL